MRQSEMVHNIIDALNVGQESINQYRDSDYSWYETAKEQTKLFAEYHGVTPTYASIILAATSRATSVWQNFVRADLFLRTGDVYFAGDYCRQLLERYAITGEIGSATSPKVSCFTDNILNGDSDQLTIDRHAISLSIGKKVSSASPTVIAKVNRAYHVVGKMFPNVPLSQLQSISWIGWRTRDSQFDFLQTEIGRHHADVFADFVPYDYVMQKEAAIA